MASSLDGRIIPSRWRPKGAHSSGTYDRIHNEIGCDAWLVGRVTGQEFAKRDGYAATTTSEAFPRAPWIAKRDASVYAVVLDGEGKIAWGRSDIGGDPIVVVLTEQVPDAHLAALRADGVSYIFAGSTKLDLAEALETLNKELGSDRILLEGGGGNELVPAARKAVDEHGDSLAAAFLGSRAHPYEPEPFPTI